MPMKRPAAASTPMVASNRQATIKRPAAASTPMVASKRQATIKKYTNTKEPESSKKETEPEPPNSQQSWESVGGTRFGPQPSIESSSHFSGWPDTEDEGIIPDRFPGFMPDDPPDDHSPAEWAKEEAPNGWLLIWEFLTKPQRLYILHHVGEEGGVFMG